MPSLLQITSTDIDEKIDQMNQGFDELVKDPIRLLRLVRSKPPMDILFSLIYILFQRKKFDLLENLIFSVIYYSEKYSLKLDFVHSLVYYLVDKDLISYIFDLQEQFTENKNVGIPLVSCLESMFSQDNIAIWYYLKVVFKSFIASLDEQNTKRGAFSINLHSLLQRQEYIDQDPILNAASNDFNSLIMNPIFSRLLYYFVGHKGMEKEYTQLKLMLIQHTSDVDLEKFKNMFNKLEKANIRAVNQTVLETELKGLADTSVRRKHFEYQGFDACDNLNFYCHNKLRLHLKKQDFKSLTKEEEKHDFKLKVLDYKKFTDPVKIEFKKIIMEPVKKPLQEMDPNHPMIAQRNRIIREQEAYIQDLAKGLLTKNLELKNFALKTQQAQQDIIEQEDVLNFRNRIERQLEQIQKGKFEDDPAKQEIDQILKQKSDVVPLTGMFSSLLANMRSEDEKLIHGSPELDELFTLY